MTQMNDPIGKTMHSRDGSETGIITKISSRHCTVCGHNKCYIVRWSDGKLTKPCFDGVKKLPDGSYQII